MLKPLVRMRFGGEGWAPSAASKSVCDAVPSVGARLLVGRPTIATLAVSASKLYLVPGADEAGALVTAALVMNIRLAAYGANGM